jgi:sterol desaturase/sphingolipid hydroxylase (fatty acid hydroxylase superfamily)
MDWIGNFRFHWMEIVVYQGLTYFPLVILGVDPLVILLVAIATTIIGHLNHSNIDITWGPLRYLFNSPRMHIWHHMAQLPGGHPTGVNFGVSFSLWDWIFRTAYWPTKEECPANSPRTWDFPVWKNIHATLSAVSSNPSCAPPGARKGADRLCWCVETLPPPARGRLDDGGPPLYCDLI